MRTQLAIVPMLAFAACHSNANGPDAELDAPHTATTGTVERGE
ncbi:MAG: hypothetical protein NT062_29550 [Proteobacteria bacterium]|nr:hypothetical protein [Pseudomonadota bacterium]